MVDGAQDLSDLVGLGGAALILDVDPWVTGPRSLVDEVGATAVSWLAEMVIAHLFKFGEPYVRWT